MTPEESHKLVLLLHDKIVETLGTVDARQTDDLACAVVAAAGMVARQMTSPDAVRGNLAACLLAHCAGDRAAALAIVEACAAVRARLVAKGAAS